MIWVVWIIDIEINRIKESPIFDLYTHYYLILKKKTTTIIQDEMIVFQQTVLRQIGSYLSRYTSNYISHPILKNWFNMNHRPKYKMQNYKISRREHKRKFAYFVRQKYVRPYDLWRKKLTSSKSKTFAFPKIRLKEWGREIENKVSAMNLLHYY